MEVKYLKEEKNEAEIEMNNLTVAEVLRAYLAGDEQVEFVAWKREHPTKNPVLKIKTKGKTVKKALQNAISSIEKEADSLVQKFKKAK
jgi:DNA-directed RNA polymerase subunit L